MIVVFGSINIDMVMRVDTLPQPGQTMLCGDYLLTPGGKGANAAVAAARAGSATALYGKVGDDVFAGPALATLRAANVDLGGVEVSKHPTGCGSVWVDASGENAIVVASGANMDARADRVPDALLGPGGIVVLQLEVPPAQNWALVERARQRGARILLNAAPTGTVPESVLRAIDVLVVNEVEASAIAAQIGLESNRPDRVPARLSERFAMVCIVTLGGTGAILSGPRGGLMTPALPVEPVDTTGAGDAFCGVLAAAMERRLDWGQALRFASVGAGLACTRIGAQSSLPDRAEIEARLAELPEPRQYD